MDHQEVLRQKGWCRCPKRLGSTTAYGINDAAEPLKDEDRSPVVIQIVALGCLNAHSHEGLGFWLCTCQKSKQSSQLGTAVHTQNPEWCLKWSIISDRVVLPDKFLNALHGNINSSIGNLKLIDFYSHITFCFESLNTQVNTIHHDQWCPCLPFRIITSNCLTNIGTQKCQILDILTWS